MVSAFYVGLKWMHEQLECCLNLLFLRMLSSKFATLINLILLYFIGLFFVFYVKYCLLKAAEYAIYIFCVFRKFWTP